MKIYILGGGITGRIVHSLVPNSTVLEAEDESKAKRLSQSYGTNYLWEPIEGFNLKEVKVVTRIDDDLPTKESVQRYKNKIGKGSEEESEWGLQFQPESRGYFIMSCPPAEILYGCRVLGIDMDARSIAVLRPDKEGLSGLETLHYDQLLSTIPLSTLVSLTRMDTSFPAKTTFKFKPVYVKVAPRPPEARFQQDDTVYVNYLSNPLQEPYRYCDRFGERHYESLMPMGFPHKKLSPGKIWKDSTTDVILKILAEQEIHCFGRYGRWNPNELMHETYNYVKMWRGENGE